MKKVFYKVLLFAIITLPFGKLVAQEIHIEETKFVHPIVEKWISEYKKENPNSTINMTVAQATENETSNLNIITQPFSGNGNDRVIYVGRYALLPVSNTHNPLLDKAAKGLKRKDLIDLVFEKDILDEDFDPDEKTKYTATVYTRSSKSSTAITLAEYFDQAFERIKGKKIFGDEIYLLNAVQKDETGITFNTLNYVFDLKSRQLKSEISLVPLHLKAKQKEVLESLNIDRLLTLLEESKIETIPVENFGLQIPAEYSNNEEVANFIRWILVHGQQYNHEYGFLNLDQETLASQKTQLENNKEYLSYSNSNK
jgi:ABC-type phosphate transport system substrate-binding protein